MTNIWWWSPFNGNVDCNQISILQRNFMKGELFVGKNIHQLIRFLLDWSILKSLTLSQTCIQYNTENLREVIWSNLLFDVSSQMLEDGPSVPSLASHHNTPQSQSVLSWQLRIVDSALFKDYNFTIVKIV